MNKWLRFIGLWLGGAIGGSIGRSLGMGAGRVLGNPYAMMSMAPLPWGAAIALLGVPTGVAVAAKLTNAERGSWWLALMGAILGTIAGVVIPELLWLSEPWLSAAELVGLGLGPLLSAAAYQIRLGKGAGEATMRPQYADQAILSGGVEGLVVESPRDQLAASGSIQTKAPTEEKGSKPGRALLAELLGVIVGGALAMGLGGGIYALLIPLLSEGGLYAEANQLMGFMLSPMGSLVFLPIGAAWGIHVAGKRTGHRGAPWPSFALALLGSVLLGVCYGAGLTVIAQITAISLPVVAILGYNARRIIAWAQSRGPQPAAHVTVEG